MRVVYGKIKNAAVQCYLSCRLYANHSTAIVKGSEMKAPLLFLILLLFILLPLQTVEAAKIFIGESPADITITEGKPLTIPIFFKAESWIGHPVELFVWKETATEKAYYMYKGWDVFLGLTGWYGFANFSDIKPDASLAKMPEYINVLWVPFLDTHNLSSFILNICLDSKVDGILQWPVSSSAEVCSQKKINIIPLRAGQ